jgi:hypothetical protein
MYDRVATPLLGIKRPQRVANNSTVINAVVQSEWIYASTSHLRNYIFVEGSFFAENNVRLAAVA